MVAGTRGRAALALTAAGAAVVLVWAAEAGAAPSGDRLQALERALREDQARAEALRRKAEALAREIETLRAASIDQARKAQDLESALTETETRIAELERAEAAKSAGLARRREQLDGTLAALQRIALQPPEALLASPGDPIDIVRSGVLLRVAIPSIERRAEALRGELREIADLRRRIALEQAELSETNAALTTERSHLTELIRRKAQAHAALTEEQRSARESATRHAAEAKDLRDLIERIEREARERAEAEERAALARRAAEAEARSAAEAEARRLEQETREPAAEPEPEPKATAPAAEAPPLQAEKETAGPEAGEAPAEAGAQMGEAPAPAPDTAARVALVRPDNIRPFPETGAIMIMPARGDVVLRYGERRGGAGASKGVAIAARGGAQIVAPFDGKVVYAGPFRSYGPILIIEHGGRYHSLLAGLDRIDAVVGQWVLAGEPVGALGSPQGGNPELYLELRRAGQPINPLPWLATTGEKVRG